MRIFPLMLHHRNDTIVFLFAVLLHASANMVAAQTVTIAGLQAQTFNTINAKPIELSPVGIAPGRPWVMELGTLPVPRTSPTQWRHLFAYKKEGRLEKQCHIASLDLSSGTIHELGTISGYEVSSRVVIDGKIYLGTNTPPVLAVYDPADDSLKNLGNPFNQSSTTYKLAPAADGSLALAGTLPAEASLFDIKTQQFTRFGSVSQINNYAYSIGNTKGFVYVATHGKGPWELVAINKSTGQQRVLLTKSNEGFMKVSGTTVRVRDHDKDAWKTFALVDGNISDQVVTTLPATVKPQSAENSDADDASSALSASEPKVLHDASTLYTSAGVYTIHFQMPGDNTWRSTTLNVPLASQTLTTLASLPDGRIVGAAPAYIPVVVFDPIANTGRQYDLPLSIRSMLGVGSKVFITGYPSSMLYAIDLNKPATARMQKPGSPGIADENPNANPRHVASFPMEVKAGGHIGFGLMLAANNRIYLVAKRHRHFRGFSVVWYDPATEKKGQFNDADAFNHLQAQGYAPTADKTGMIVTTSIEPNNQIPGTPPASPALFVLDLIHETVAQRFTPVPDASTLGPITIIANNKAIGLACDKDETRTLVYRINLENGAVEKAVLYSAVLRGLGNKGLVTAPDGSAWSSVSHAADISAILRIDPDTLEIRVLGTVPTNTPDVLFQQGRTYFAAGEKIQRVNW